MTRSIAVIGSFKQHHEHIQHACERLRSAGFVVTSPQGQTLLENGVDFVRFSTDDPNWPDPAIQSLAMHRILRADLVYVLSPKGYIGRTTCYEIGRIVQKGRPIYFSERPNDLPIHIPPEYILAIDDLISRLSKPGWIPLWMFAQDSNQTSLLERKLKTGKLIND